MIVSQTDVELFQKLIDENRYDFCKLAYILWPFGEEGSELESKAPFDWQMEEWAKLSKHLQDPVTRYEVYQACVSSGNGAAKTAWGAMTLMMLMYTQKLRARITANTDPQMKSVVWPEYDKWYRLARFHDVFFDKFGTSIKARNEQLADRWRIDTVTWQDESPTGISGLHNEGNAVAYVFEEAPGIPASIFKYATGAFSDKNTIKLFLAFGNSDDPESYFEQQCMSSPLWNSRRIDTRTLKHIDPKQISNWLIECGGNEDHDDFRVRVRGLPRKTSKDSIIGVESVQAALERRHKFDTNSVQMLPCVLACDPAWQGGDETTIWYQQGNYRCMLEKYRLDRAAREDHMLTYNRLVHWEKELRADAVFIDQGEGTAIWTFANQQGKYNWHLISFASSPNDTPDTKESQFANIRAQMYYETAAWLRDGGILDAKNPDWIPLIEKQLCWTKGGRHKITQKKIAEPKIDIKTRVGQSPDVADGCVLCGAQKLLERLPEHDMHSGGEAHLLGSSPLRMPDHTVEDLYDIEPDYQRLYD
jgi:hypothetical protein